MARRYIPHAGKKLDETTVSESQRDDNGRGFKTSSTQVDQTEDKGGESEGRETERSRVGEFATLDGLVETWLELTTKG